MKNWIMYSGLGALIFCGGIVLAKLWHSSPAVDPQLAAAVDELKKRTVTREELNTVLAQLHEREMAVIKLIETSDAKTEAGFSVRDSRIAITNTDWKMAVKRLELTIVQADIKRLGAAEATEQKKLDEMKRKRDQDSASTEAYIKRMEARQATRAAENATPPAPVSKAP
jgi:hypothetical protein